MTYDLLPCPFCGSRDTYIIASQPQTICCETCGAHGPEAITTGDAREAVALWNQRLDSERDE